jgi:hypothetical protein
MSDNTKMSLLFLNRKVVWRKKIQQRVEAVYLFVLPEKTSALNIGEGVVKS